MTDRRARLAALAAKAGRGKKVDTTANDKDEKEPEEKEQEQEQQQVKFRNYAPQDKELDGPERPNDNDDQPPSFKKQRVEGKSALEQALEEAKE